jgi:hypothetical protein
VLYYSDAILRSTTAYDGLQMPSYIHLTAGAGDDGVLQRLKRELSGAFDATFDRLVAKLDAVMTADHVAAARAACRLQEIDQGAGFFLLDGQPAPTETAPAASTPPPVTQDPGPAPAAIAAMRDQLRGGGVQIATVQHLFCTSPELAQRMVALAELERSHRVLEPSARHGRPHDGDWRHDRPG